jgi:hypothetical protein
VLDVIFLTERILRKAHPPLKEIKILLKLAKRRKKVKRGKNN